MLAALRMKPALLTVWLQSKPTVALPVIGLILAGAAASVLPLGPGASVSGEDRSDAATQAPSQGSLLEQIAAAPGAVADTTADDEEGTGARERAAAQLRDYASRIQEKRQAIASIGTDVAGSGQAALPDVDTMIARLAARLQTNPSDEKGWNTLGWAYASTGKYAEAVAAYEKAAQIDPANDEIKSALATVRAKVAGASAAEGAKADNTSDPAPVTASTGAPATADQSAMIRGMVDRLAQRLETSPNDADGWLRLMKARTVLGETDLAREALRKALAVLAGDQASRDRVAEGAKDLGLSAY
jgi:cytochrome c-type biogenesis protein CcmH